jgi:UDP-N-acetylglucosamine 2-epimerase (non-hydrolysing)
MRDNTERPITVEIGTNVLAGTDPVRVARIVKDTLRAPRRGRVPELWDGKAAIRTVDVIERWWRARSPR